MPFTFSHPAIVLPLKKIKPQWFSLTGLVIGSMSPDIMYFFQMSGEEDYGHTLAGLFVFDLPATVLLTLIYHRYIRNTLILYLPSPYNRKFAKYLSQNIFLYMRKNWHIILFSALTGAVSHIFWDDLGNPQGWIYAQAPEFFGKSVTFGPFSLKVFLLIEYAGSLLGLVFLFWLFVIEPGEKSLPRVSWSSKFLYWFSIFFFTGVVIIVKLLAEHRKYSVGSMFVIGISGFCMAVIITSILFNFRKPINRILSQ